MNKQKIAVIGAGIIGVNCALELQSLGFEVTLLDKNAIGEGCSKSNAGHFATEQVFPLAEYNLLWQLPKLLLDPLGPVALSPRYIPKAMPWFMQFIRNMRSDKRQQNSAALRALNKHAIDYYKPILKAANAEHLLTCKGSLLVFEDTRLSEIHNHFEHYKSAGVSVKLLDRQQTLLLEPNLSESIKYSLYFTDVGHSADPYKICLELAMLAQSKGVVYQHFCVQNIKQLDSQIMISDQHETQSFDQVVISTGAWSKPLLNQLGYKLPIEAERGYSLSLHANGQVAELTRPVASAERRFIMTPMEQGLRLAGTVEFAGLEQQANMKRADMLYQHAQQMLNNIADFNEKAAKKEQRWLGFRPSLPDSLPVICTAPNNPKVHFALGHQHLGLTQGAITGKLIGQLISRQPTDIDVSPFCISRFN
ncbi:NAD(P)/FAD-dependent oxidoreductase [Colwelliaceae bacterium 6471]